MLPLVGRNLLFFQLQQKRRSSGAAELISPPSELAAAWECKFSPAYSSIAMALIRCTRRAVRSREPGEEKESGQAELARQLLAVRPSERAPQVATRSPTCCATRAIDWLEKSRLAITAQSARKASSCGQQSLPPLARFLFRSLASLKATLISQSLVSRVVLLLPDFRRAAATLAHWPAGWPN